jgi:hypothetical protein
MFPSPPQFSRTRPPWSVVGKQKCSFFVSWLELAMMKRSGGLRESCSTSPRRSLRLHTPSPRPENPDQDSGTIEALQLQAALSPCRARFKWVRDFDWAAARPWRARNKTCWPLTGHLPSIIYSSSQVRVLGGSWALDKLIRRFISILPLSSDDGFHSSYPPNWPMAHRDQARPPTPCDCTTV